MPVSKTSPFKRTRLLIASPDRYFRIQTGEILSGSGYGQLRSADTARGVLESVARDDLDIILLDEDLPLLSPPELLRMIRGARLEGYQPRIVLIVARPTRTVVEEARRAGFDALIAKPIIPVRLIRTIEHLHSVGLAA